MQLFVGNRLNLPAFDDDVCRASNGLADVWALAAQTQSPAVESTHFLIVLARIPGGVTQRTLARRGLTVEQWETGLLTCVRKGGSARPAPLTQSSLDQSAVDMLRGAAQKGLEARLDRASEPLLLWAGLKNLTPGVRELCQTADVSTDEWCEELERLIVPRVRLAVFSDRGVVVVESFASDGRRVLRLLKSETESLGYPRADPRHLLLAMLAQEGGATHYALHHQGAAPRKVQEATTVSLRARARKKRSAVPLDAEHLQPILQNILTLAGQLAEQTHARAIGEPHLLRAFLATESTARQIVLDQKLDLATLRKTAEEYDPGADADEEDEAALADIATVRDRLKERLVGQDQAIDTILPYIEYMRFGLRTPDHPVGVFFFCGQSGSGKTEMAKELARAVYGSEDNLIFLEMGQFNSPESMNIFVGAPPGYIGYGEGKLTNGLRDKPSAVVLFDEVEKAHPKVLDALLRFLDEGKVDDPAGPVRDGSECIVILTSNAAADKIDDIWKQVSTLEDPRTEIRKKLREELGKRRFRVEFLNRVDEVLLFNTLKEGDYVEIAERFLKRFLGRLQEERMIAVQVDDSVAKCIGKYCAEVNEGARAVPRLARGVVILPVVRHVLERKLLPPVRLRVRAVPTSGGEPRGIVERG